MTNAERNLIYFSAAMLLVISAAQWRNAVRTRHTVSKLRAIATALSAATMAGIHAKWFGDLPGSGTILMGMATLSIMLIVASFVMNRRTSV